MSYYFLKTVFKKLLAAAAALAASTPAAFAGPYLNWETNLSYTGSDYNSSLHELHVGWEGENGPTSYFIQGGPAYSAVDAADNSGLEFSGKAGGAVAVSESVSIYGELSLVTAVENGYGAKGGVKYSF
tara:strand:+ start:999 stop:1382 length:384 start_codon:yes stop_codon:yes gene_type:complete